MTRPLRLALVVAALVVAAPAAADAATLVGTTTVQASLDSNTPGRAEAFTTTATASGTIASLSVYLDGGSTATKVVIGLYAGSGTHPGALLTQGTIASPTAGAWNTVDVPAASVTSGTAYWLAVLGPTGQGSVRFRDRSGGAAAETSSSGSLATLPATWSTGTRYTDAPLSAYASTAAGPPAPVLSVAPSSLSFSATQGASNPAPKSLSVTNTGTGSLTFTADRGSASWLSVTPTSGSAPATLQVSADASGLTAGTYNGQVTITSAGAQGSPATVPVTFTVNSAPPPPPPSGSDWLQISHDAGRSGFASGETAITTANAPDLKLAWGTGLDGKITAAPLYAANVTVGGSARDVVIAATEANSIYAVDAQSGAILWRRNFGTVANNCAIPGGFGITGPPAIDKAAGRVYAVSGDGVLRTINLADGTDAASGLTLISRPATNKVWGGLNLSGGSLYVATASDGCDSAPWRGTVYKVDVSGAAPTLVTSWAVVSSIPAPNGGGGIWGYGGVSVDTANGRVYATPGDDSNEGFTPYADRMVALDSGLNVLGSWEPSHPTSFPCTGAPCDLDFGSTPVVFKPAGCPTMVAAGNKDGNLYVEDADALAANAAPRQTIALNAKNDWLGSGGVGGTPAYSPDGRMVIVTDAGSGLGTINAGVVGLHVETDCTLTVAWSTPLGGGTQPNSTPTIANGVVYVGEGNGGKVHAYDIANGHELWSGGGPAATYAAPIVAGGMVFAGSWNGFADGDAGTLRAFAPNASPPPPPPPPPPTGTQLIGTNVIQAQADQNTTGQAEAFQATATATGTLASLSVYLDAGSAATKVVVGIYADNGANTHPGALLAQAATTSPTAGAWNTIALPSAPVTSGGRYWLALLGAQGGTIRFHDKAGGCKAETSASASLTALPATWASGVAYTDCPLSGYGSSA